MSYREKRVRTLTPKAMALYEQKVTDYKSRTRQLWSKVSETLTRSVITTDVSVKELDRTHSELLEKFVRFEEEYHAFEKFLATTNTLESLAERDILILEQSPCLDKYDQWIRLIESTKQEILKQVLSSINSNQSVRSSVRSSKRSSARSVGSSDTLAKKRAEAEAAKVKVQFAEAEAAIIKQKAFLDADLNVLKHQKEAAATAAEVKVLERSAVWSDVGDNESDLLKHIPVSDPKQLVEKYLETVQIPQQYERKNVKNQNIGNELSKFLLKKDLALSRLSVFSDKPEAYNSWKTSFQQVMKEMDVTPSEEMDLLVKWLGAYSKTHAISIRSAFRKDPQKAHQKLWERLDERYGAVENIHHSITKKLENFPKLSYKDSGKWYELADLLAEIEALKEDVDYSTALSYFDTSIGVAPVLSKLPPNIQERWASRANTYKKQKRVAFPPFSVFMEFISDQATIRNDPSLQPAVLDQGFKDAIKETSKTKTVFSKKTDVPPRTESDNVCPIHKAKHHLNECYAFKRKSSDERKQFLRENRICFKCCNSSKHRARECEASIKCEVCGSTNHISVMHIYSKPQEDHGGVKLENRPVRDAVNSKCTEIDKDFKSCAKIVLVNVVSETNPDNVVKCYAIVDEQSNKTLAKPELFDRLCIDAPEQEYCINSCAGTTVTSGRRVSNCNVTSVSGNVCYNLPTIIECADIPSSKHEICTPDNVRKFPHLSDVIDQLPQFDKHAEILLLLGRDVIDVHHVLEQVVGPPGTPFAQRLGLGWVVIGELCLGNFHVQHTVNVNKLQLLSNGRHSLFKSCDHVRTVVDNRYSYDPVFIRTAGDNQRSLSVEDQNFLQIMDSCMQKHESGHWIAPLPFKDPRERLPNNRELALKRAQLLHSSLSKNPVKKRLLVEFMSKVLENGHAEIATPLSKDEECWYLPVFGVFHLKKPNQIRGVFDSSAQFRGISLNSVLLSGPDLTNSLLGVLMRFRNEQVPVTADIEQMFYSFLVEEKHRNFLRFLWYKDNNPDNELADYRMRVHVFGNSCSPAVATYGLRKSVADSDPDVREFVSKDFYVDDALTSKPSPELVVDLIKRAQNDLATSGLRLHKIASSSVEVMKSFDVADLAKDIKCLDFENEALPIQRSLGVSWVLDLDCFTFKVEPSSRPLTRRGILATINSLFDPLGFVAPVSVVGKLILRLLMSFAKSWDEPVPPDVESKFLSWRDSLKDLSEIQIPRSYFKVSVDMLSNLELHVFSDASELAISAVAYVVGISSESKEASFVLGKSKVAPRSGHTIPRLELCAAVLAVELADAVVEHIGISVSATKFYTDSRIVLGYIHNQSRRFFTYVSNRAQRIRQSSTPQQWNYICSSRNPADIGSRGSSPEHLQMSLWLSGPSFLCESMEDMPEIFPLLSPEDDTEVRPDVQTLATTTSSACCTWTHRFSRFSSWERLVAGISVLRYVACTRHKKLSDIDLHPVRDQFQSLDLKRQSELFILHQVQLESYQQELDCLKNLQPVPKSSPLLALDPFLDVDGLLKVGGRLHRSTLPLVEKHPVILPGKHHVSKLLAIHCHDAVQHQGRHLTEGAVRSAGYWITGGKRLVASLIFNCVKCKKLRGHFETQKMSDLPSDRIERTPPFSHVGVDVFGPWNVVSRRTRGGQACSKRWAVMFTCLAIRAVHIEIIEEMTSSAFINSLRRFMAIRGKVKVFRSDRGTNFVGATECLKIDAINVEGEKTKTFLYKSDSIWLFNSPHSSHFGGSWERMIGITRRILDSMLGNHNISNLTHDVLVTVMAEVCAIINARPLVPVSTDCENPEVLSPSVLLTQKLLCDQQPVGDMDIKLLYKDQWKRVQYLADQFWLKWKRDYLQTLQKRQKWNSERDPIALGDVVFLKDKGVVRNRWPMGLISQIFPSEDGRIRKAEVVIFNDGKRSSYVRPIVDMVLLVKAKH